jgi:cellulose synthase/poly-beta-1,6-N-acetylglucosamine synthase-like glycosyltransferase
MHLIGLVPFSFIFAFWILQGLRIARGALRLPHLKDQELCEPGDCPSISLLFAARNEAEKLPQALATLEKIDYPALEIIAVNDRSTDVTSAILRGAAEQDGRIKIVNVGNLPGGWLGKPHALHADVFRSFHRHGASAIGTRLRQEEIGCFLPMARHVLPAERAAPRAGLTSLRSAVYPACA